MAPDQQPPGLGDPEVAAHGFEALAKLSVAVEIRDPTVLELREDFLHSHQHAGQAHLGKAAGALEREQDDLVDVAVPVLLGPAPEVPAADQAGLVIVRAEVGGAGMRHLDRDQRDVRFAILRGHDRGDVLVGLELDDQVDLLAHQDVGVPLGDLRVVAVVDANQLDALSRGGALEPGRDFLGELVVGALRGVTEPMEPLPQRPDIRSVEVFTHLLDHPAALERVEQPERHALGEPAPRRDLAERQRLAG